MPTLRTPEWARQAVWYQIVPERFRNGDETNDPTADTLESPPIRDWHTSRWTGDWYAIDAWEQALGGFSASVWHRRYGGDLKGIRDALDYLQDLGVNALYLTPVFHARSLHKYDGMGYHHIDPHFGPDPAGDKRLIAAARESDDPRTWVWTAADRCFLDLVRELHERNMRIILDGVFNHTGRDCFAYQDLLAHGKQSRYADWYAIEKWDAALPHGFKARGWFGHASLPEFARQDGTLAPAVREYIINCTRRWMDPGNDGNTAAGIDGWRLDVAFCVPHAFWKEWRAVVNSINQDAYLVGEIIDVAPEYLQGDEFDALMNYPFLFCLSEFLMDRKHRVTATVFDQRLRQVRDAYPPGATAVMQNLLGSHDTQRLASAIVNPDLGYRDWGTCFSRSQVLNNSAYEVRKPAPEEIQRMKLAVLFQMTYLGAPMVYYGDEAGLWGANDPCCRKPMLWPELPCDVEAGHPHGGTRAPDETAFNHDLFAYYRTLIHARRGHSELMLGDYATLLADDARQVFVFSRTFNGRSAIVIINNSDQSQCVAWPSDWPSGAFSGVLTHQPGAQGVIRLAPVSGDLFCQPA